MRLFKKKEPDIENYRKDFDPNKCEIKYYLSLVFLDIYDDPKKVNKKKSKSLIEITTPYHSIGYFLNGKLIRIDNVGSGIPKETYLIWENDLIKEAHEFFLGLRYDQKISKKTQPGSSWFYTYEKDKTKKIVWIDYEDRKYYDHGEMKVIYDYEYDEKGLLFIQKTFMGPGRFGKKPDVAKIYDRERENFLQTCTITKSGLIAIEAKNSDNIINFNVQEDQKTCDCKKCGKPLSYIATINLLDKRFNSTNIVITHLPILHCFDCLETQSYHQNDLQILVHNKTPFTQQLYKFKRTTDDEILESSFLKLGGQPAWIQNDEHPKCTSCAGTMKFIVEINTDEDLTNEIETLAFGDSGKLYVFACCENITTIPQWY